jgi:N-acetylneuraminic acid mutarotase
MKYLRSALSIFVVAALIFFACLPVQASAVGQWALTGSMNSQHWFTALIKLQDGRAMTMSGGAIFSASEIYEPATGQWVLQDNVNLGRDQFNPVLLNNGKVLIAGGQTTPGDTTNTAELFDPSTGHWSYTTSMNVPRRASLLVKLLDGRVMAIGGMGTQGGDQHMVQSEIYDPTTAQWSFSGTLNVLRGSGLGSAADGGAILLNDGRVLATGSLIEDTTTAEIYDPATGQWGLTGSMHYPSRDRHLVKLGDGRILAIGGDKAGEELATVEIFDPTTETWTETGSLHYQRGGGFGAVLLSDGRVLIAGGQQNANATPVMQSEIYDPTTGQWSIDATVNHHHIGGNMVMLDNGKVLIAGGFDTVTELYTGMPVTPLVYPVSTNTRSTSGNNSVTATISTTGIPAGDTVAVSVATGTFAGALGCSDSRGNTYSVVADRNSGQGRVFVCTSRLTMALTAGDTITAAYPMFSGISVVSVNAIAAFASNGIVTAVSSANGNSATPNSGNITVGGPTVLFGAIAHNSTPTLTVGSGYTLVGQVSGGTGSSKRTLSPEFRIVSGAGIYNSNAIISNGGQFWQAVIVGYAEN